MAIWIKVALKMVVLPVLKKISVQLVEKARVTSSETDDKFAASLRVVVDGLEAGEVLL